MKKQTIELRFLSDRFLKWAKINFTLTPIIAEAYRYLYEINAGNPNINPKVTTWLSLAPK